MDKKENKIETKLTEEEINLIADRLVNPRPYENLQISQKYIAIVNKLNEMVKAKTN